MNRVNLFIMKLKMFITSYFPLYIILLVLQIKQYPLVLDLKDIFIPATVFALMLLVFVFISIMSTVDLFRTKGNEQYTYESLDRSGDAVISYMMTYIVPLLSETFLTYRGFVINATLFVLIGVMYIKLDLIYFNPMWIILGYTVYLTNNGDWIISNIPYGILKQNIGNSLKSSYLVKGGYLIQRKDNLECL